jgi:hypothetical protein
MLPAFTLLASLTLTAPPQRTPDLVEPTDVLELEGIWLFHAGDNPAFARANLDDLDWEQRQLPATTTPWQDRWRGHAWYRLHFVASQQATQSDLLVALGPAREVVEVYINGALVARRGRFGSRPEGGAHVLPLTGIIPANILVSGDNVLAVRMYDPSYKGGLAAGPLLLGAPDAVQQRLGAERYAPMAVRLGLGMLALVLCCAQVMLVRARRNAQETLWIAGAALGLALVHIDGTGILTALVPSLELAIRLPVVASFTAVLCLASFFASRFGDNWARHVAWGRAGLAILGALVLLAPDAVVFLLADPALLLAGVVTTLFAAHLLLQTARRDEKGALPVFASLMVLAVLLLYDGVSPSLSDVWPPSSLIGAVGVVLIAAVVGARQVASESEAAQAHALKARRELDDLSRIGILEGAAMSITTPQRFLETVMHEAARAIEVRRCSLVLAQGTDLVLAAAVGLPKHATSTVVPKEGSVAGTVFREGRPMTDKTLPKDATRTRRVGTYLTDAFISYPVQQGEQVLGVLNVSDRNDGGPFSAEDEIAVAEVAQKLAIVLTRLWPNLDLRRS